MYVAVIIYYCTIDSTHILHETFELQDFNFLARRSIKEFCRFGTREVAERTQQGERHSIQPPLNHKVISNMDLDFIVHAYRTNELCATCITHASYPQRVAYRFLEDCLLEFQELYPTLDPLPKDRYLAFPDLDYLLHKYKDPTDVDKILKINNELVETKEELYKAFDALLERGDKIDNIVAKSNDLNHQSRTFLNKSKQLNSCCIIL